MRDFGAQPIGEARLGALAGVSGQGFIGLQIGGRGKIGQFIGLAPALDLHLGDTSRLPNNLAQRGKRKTCVLGLGDVLGARAQGIADGFFDGRARRASWHAFQARVTFDLQTVQSTHIFFGH